MTYLIGPSYVLGEHELPYTGIERLAELSAQFKLAPQPGLWGWGTVRTTSRELEELAVETGRASLDAAGNARIDAVVLCSNRIPGPAEGHGEFVARVLTGTGLGDIPAYGINLNRCVNLLAGLDVARSLVLSGRYRRVLVITTDKVAGDADRMSQFALFSDGAASCVVAADRPGASPFTRSSVRRRRSRRLRWSGPTRSAPTSPRLSTSSCLASPGSSWATSTCSRTRTSTSRWW